MGLFHRKSADKPHDIGAYGEKLTAKFLKKRGYRICAMNHRADGHEELDIVCENKTERVFVEVKTRTGSPDDEWKYGRPASAVTHEKRRHLLSAARAYNIMNPTKKTFRMDVVEVYLPPEGDAVFHHIIDAFRS